MNVAVHERGDTIIEIANLADKALYHAKDAGRNAICLLTPEGADTMEKSAGFVKIDF